MNRKYVVGGIALALIVVGVLVAVSLIGGKDDSTSASTITGVEKVKAELAGIPQSGSTLGQADAPVEIVEYGDTSCPICKDASETSVSDLIAKYVKTGKVKLTFRPVAFVHPTSSERGALGVEAAAMQNAVWPLVGLIYANQRDEHTDWLTDDTLKKIVAAAGIDEAKWETDYKGEAAASAFFASRQDWEATGGTGTPTFVITGPRGSKTFAGAEGISKFDDAIAQVGPA